MDINKFFALNSTKKFLRTKLKSVIEDKVYADNWKISCHLFLDEFALFYLESTLLEDFLDDLVSSSFMLGSNPPFSFLPLNGTEVSVGL